MDKCDEHLRNLLGRSLNGLCNCCSKSCWSATDFNRFSSSMADTRPDLVVRGVCCKNNLATGHTRKKNIYSTTPTISFYQRLTHIHICETRNIPYRNKQGPCRNVTSEHRAIFAELLKMKYLKIRSARPLDSTWHHRRSDGRILQDPRFPKRSMGRLNGIFTGLHDMVDFRGMM